jgi:acetylornithine aminotransferase
MIGIELTEPYKEIRQQLLFNEHIFTGCAGTHVLRLLPPLCLSMSEADEFLEKFTKHI